ncbi:MULTISPECIES: hypothetical protein [Streptomyces]|uniref:Uncharacterized protein n=1 Tax=Streptomyces silvisoli TaxID=3034235 RepID=A0ABT5ZDK8_9ACTN|nr:MULTISPECIES: hypothetical protein [Streptomyces]MDF3287664.1 hypothetical protein [Streptomyces silvisoli]
MWTPIAGMSKRTGTDLARVSPLDGLAEGRGAVPPGAASTAGGREDARQSA